jgi:hypothetical protein
MRLTHAGWQAARTVPVQLRGIEPCLPHFGCQPPAITAGPDDQ